jgi:hypothetical protein
VTPLFDNLGAMITGTFLAFALLLMAPVFAKVPAAARVKLRRLRRRYFPSSLLID